MRIYPLVKRVFALFASLMLLLSTASGCGSEHLEADKAPARTEGPLIGF